MIKKIWTTIFRSFWSSRHKVEFFRKGKNRQTDDDFLRECAVNSDLEKEIALAVRKVIAKLGEIDSQYIFHDAKYPNDLDVLPFWDSVDAIYFTMELEDKLGIEIPDNESDQLWSYEPFAVKELVHKACKVIKPKLEERNLAENPSDSLNKE